jgi:hypothetical protein
MSITKYHCKLNKKKIPEIHSSLKSVDHQCEGNKVGETEEVERKAVNTGTVLLPLDGGAFESFRQFGASLQSFRGVNKGHPFPVSLVLLWPFT